MKEVRRIEDARPELSRAEKREAADLFGKKVTGILRRHKDDVVHGRDADVLGLIIPYSPKRPGESEARIDVIRRIFPPQDHVVVESITPEIHAVYTCDPDESGGEAREIGVSWRDLSEPLHSPRTSELKLKLATTWIRDERTDPDLAAQHKASALEDQARYTPRSYPAGPQEVAGLFSQFEDAKPYSSLRQIGAKIALRLDEMQAALPDKNPPEAVLYISAEIARPQPGEE